MKTFTIMACLILMSFAAGAGAGELKVIELKDGSVITGDVLSLSGGIYTVKSDSLGIVRLEESKIRVIRSKSTEKNGASAELSAAPGSDTYALQQKMMGDKEVMGMIQSLQDDPEFKKLLEDPVMIKAIQAGDVAALMASPQFMKLLSNPTVKEIEKKVQP